MSASSRALCCRSDQQSFENDTSRSVTQSEMNNRGMVLQESRVRRRWTHKVVTALAFGNRRLTSPPLLAENSGAVHPLLHV